MTDHLLRRFLFWMALLVGAVFFLGPEYDREVAIDCDSHGLTGDECQAEVSQEGHAI